MPGGDLHPCKTQSFSHSRTKASSTTLLGKVHYPLCSINNNVNNNHQQIFTMTEVVPAVVTISPEDETSIAPTIATNETTEEDREAKNLLAKWDDENETNETVDDDDDDDDDLDYLDYDERTEKYRRDVVVDNNALDHILLGTSDFPAAVEQFESMTGLKPEMVLSLNGLGTVSARVAFESCCFLEIVGPDPKQEGKECSPLKTALEALPKDEENLLTPLHYAVRKSDATSQEFASDFLPSCGYDGGVDNVTMVGKDRGMPWKWDLVFLQGHSDGGLAPMFTRWADDVTHGAAKLPIVGTIDRVTVTTNGGFNGPIHKVLEGVDGIDVKDGADCLLEFEFTSKANGETLKFSSSNPIGVSFPMTGGLNC